MVMGAKIALILSSSPDGALRNPGQKGGRLSRIPLRFIRATCWDFKPVQWYPGKHPCEKPLDLMRHIVEASSRPGETVLDTFAGSGSTAIACGELGRVFVGCEMGEGEFDGAVKRLNDQSENSNINLCRGATI
jgi:DNA modification methylase